MTDDSPATIQSILSGGVPTHVPVSFDGIPYAPVKKGPPPAEGSVEATLVERGKRYGQFHEHAAIAQGLKREMHKTPGWANLSDDKKEALEMTQHKIARILNGDPEYHDNWHDIGGYVKLVADRLVKS